MFGQTLLITLKVSDGISFSQEILQVKISDNHAPVLLKPFPETILHEGESKDNAFILDEHFTDQDGDQLSFFSIAKFVGVNIQDDLSVTITATGSWSGTETITFRATDPFGAMIEGYAMVKVIEINNPPQISPIPDIYIHYDHKYEFNLSQYVFDPDNQTIELSIWTSDNEHIEFAEFDKLLMLLNFPKNMLGQSVKIKIFVTDGLNTTENEFIVYITDNYPPALKKPIPDIVLQEDFGLPNAINLMDYFMDPDKEPLTFSYKIVDEQNISISINVNGSVDVTSSQDWFGTTVGVLKAEDKSHSFIESPVTISVIPVNDPPEIENIPVQHGKAGERWVLDLSPYLQDIDNELADLEIDIESSSAHLATVTGKQLTFHSDEAVNTNIQIIISDGSLSSTGNVSLIISASKIENPQTNLQTVWILSIIIVLIIIGILMVVFKNIRGSFKLTDIFVIHRDGLLIKYKGTTFDEDVDEDIFSGMLSGIQSFISDSFGRNLEKADSKWVMNQLRMGNFELMVEEGKNVIVVGVYRGKPGRRLPKILAEVVKKIENTHGKKLEHWDGRLNKVKKIDNIIDPYIYKLK
jgi:hypothetical protein